MFRYALMASMMVITLAGCASKPSKEAPIETRGEKPAALGAATPVVAVAKPVVVEQVQVRKAVVGEGPQTRPLQADELNAKPLGTQAASEPVQNVPVAESVVVAPVRPKLRVFQFEYDSAALAATDHAVLEAHSAFLKAQPKLEILVQGHADERGSREYNLSLGQRRAESVKQALGLLGIPEARVEAVSLGAEKPVAEGHDETAWRLNRRAIVIYKDE